MPGIESDYGWNRFAAVALRPLFSLLVVLSVSLGASPLGAAWRHFRSPNFELYVDGTGSYARSVLHHLEQVRSVFSRIEGSSYASDKPVRMIVFNSRHQFTKLFGRGESAYAFYFQSRERNYMVFQELNADLMYETAVHEYAHLRANEGGLSLPYWLSEGLAQLYSTMWPDGSKVRLGRAPKRVSYYGVGAYPSLADLLSARRDYSISPAKRQRLYIKAWALTRLLALGEAYRGKFPELLLAVSAGEQSEAAIREVYGKTVGDLTRDLSDQLKAGALPMLVFDTHWDREKNPLEPRKVDHTEEALLKADLLRRTGQSEDARQLLEDVLTQRPDDPRALAELGRIQQDDKEAVAAFARAAEHGSTDPYLYLDYARAALRLPDTPHDSVRQALRRSSDLAPVEADTHVLLAAYAEQRGDLATQILYLRKARGMKSSGEYVRLVQLARALAASDSKMQAQVAAAQAGRLVHTAEQLAEVHSLLGAREAPLARVDELLREKQGDEAAALLVALQKRYPGAVPVYERLAVAQDLRGAKQQAETFRHDARLHGWAARFEARRDAPSILRWTALLDAAGLHAASDRYFANLTDLHPTDWEFRNNRAYSLAEDEIRLDLARQLAEEGLQHVPEDRRSSLQDTLGWILLKTGRVEEALEIFETLSEQERDNRIFRFHLAAALREAGRQEEAMRTFDRLLRDKRISDAFREKVERERNAGQ